MRFVVCREGVKEYNDPRVILVGALGIGGPRIPVVFNFFHDEVIGWAEEFQREVKNDAAELSFDITFVKPMYKDICEGLASPPTVWVNKMFEHRGSDDVSYVSSGIIREICFVISINPGARI